MCIRDRSKAVTGYPLDYVQFERPDSSKGALYYDYSSNGSYDSPVSYTHLDVYKRQRQAGAAYTDSYLQQMVDWGFMRGDISGNLRPDNPISPVSYTHLGSVGQVGTG